MDQAATYRTDLRYVQTQVAIHDMFGTHLYGTREQIVGPFRWWFYRLQFWRFEKRFKDVSVLRDRRLKP